MEIPRSLKGDLRKSKADIIRITIRSHGGMPMHKAEFRADDKKMLVKELNLLKDKFGADCFSFKREFSTIDKKQRFNEMNNEKEYLDNWRENTKFLRNEDQQFKEKMKSFFQS